MNFEKLRELSQDFEVSIANDDTFKMPPPHYYGSLRNAFHAFFKTFQSTNAMYEYHAEGLSRIEAKRLNAMHVDSENITIALIGFERFFELYLKDLMGSIEPKLIQRSKYKKPSQKIKAIEDFSFEPNVFGNVVQQINFYETIELYFHIANQIKGDQCSPLLDSLKETISKRDYLLTEEAFATLKYLNWIRDRLLHDGSQIPSLWLFDYIVTQQVCPLIHELFKFEKDSIGGFPFYITTVTGINIIEYIVHVKFDFKELKDKTRMETIFSKLLYIGHLKELGRANFNMNLHMRNGKATFEYNYNDAFGRGERFAKSEKKHENFKKIKTCPCCEHKSLVLYSLVIDDFFNEGQKLDTQWVKCYTCEYHVRYNAGDPVYFNLSETPVFEYP